MTYSDVIKMKQFGVVTLNVCNFELNKLLDNLDDNLPQDANAFFELFIQDANGDLVDVPVLITNFKDAQGNYPNQDFNFESSRLVRRFFVYDTITGIESEGGYLKGQSPNYIRFASKVSLTVQLHQGEQKERIQRPLLQITYTEMDAELIKDESTTEVTYFVDYYEETSYFWQTMQVIFITLQFLIAGVVGLRSYSYAKHNPPRLFKNKVGHLVGKIVYNLAHYWSTIMFWVSFFCCMYWFIMYKMQDNAYILLPST